jgi:hypothetical protein
MARYQMGSYCLVRTLEGHGALAGEVVECTLKRGKKGSFDRLKIVFLRFVEL